MFRKTLISLVCLILIVATGGYAFRAALWEKAQVLITQDMYVDADNDDFSPGLSVGERFPALRALHNGQEITAIDAFVHDKGMIFIANRSADW